MSSVLTASSTRAAAGLRFLGPVWFAPVMGLCGLSLAWHAAAGVLGEGARAAGSALGGLSALAFVLVFAASLRRAMRHREQLLEDLRHPVRHPFVAAVPVSLVLLATTAQAAFGPGPAIAALWMVGAALQFAATLWVLGRWLAPGGWNWASFTPVLFIPVVGNVLLPLAAVPLGLHAWAAAQFGIGVLFWPVVLALLGVRIGQLGLWPDRLLPSTFITVAPPAVIGMAVLRLGAPAAVGWACWGMALFFLSWSALAARRIVAQPFHVGWWGLSFLVAAFAALTLALAPMAGAAFTGVAVLALAAASGVVGLLVLATVRGLAQGSLLVPEPPPPGPAPR